MNFQFRIRKKRTKRSILASIAEKNRRERKQKKKKRRRSRRLGNRRKKMRGKNGGEEEKKWISRQEEIRLQHQVSTILPRGLGPLTSEK